jgi:aryl-alcohol dehydrogenase-like predicted oxidoreductase
VGGPYRFHHGVTFSILIKLFKVAEFVGIAKTNGWIQPTVYQGKYNVVERSVEAEWVKFLYVVSRTNGLIWH